MGRSRKTSHPFDDQNSIPPPADDEDTNHPPADQNPFPPPTDQDRIPPPLLPADDQNMNHRPADHDPILPPTDQDQNPPPPAEIGLPPNSGGYQQIMFDQFFRSFEERETRREEKIAKLEENFRKITYKLTVSKRNMATLKREKNGMETSHNAMLRRTVGNSKKKLVKVFKKWVDKKNDEFKFCLQYSEMNARLKLIKSYNAGKLDLTSEETKLKLGLAFMDNSDVDPSSSDDDAGPSGTAHEPDADSSDE